MRRTRWKKSKRRQWRLLRLKQRRWRRAWLRPREDEGTDVRELSEENIMSADEIDRLASEPKAVRRTAVAESEEEIEEVAEAGRRRGSRSCRCSRGGGDFPW